MADVTAQLRRIRRAVTVRRRLLAALCAAGAVAVSLDVLTPPRPALATVLSAARDIPAGTTVSEADVTPLRLPPELVPDGALQVGAPVIGRRVSSAVRRGEALTDVRLVGPGLLSGLHGDDPDGTTVAVPVRLGDRDAAGLVTAGDRVDVLAAPLAPGDDTARSVEVVAVDVLVLAVPADDETSEGSLLIVAVRSPTARSLARAATTARLSIALRGAR
ncbi:MAG TPA: Flp pilus assembly protein CpaB [Mycobacteriales bacterium]|nr:Flp pilus assembly protein CpaB [Mycobacteriales bacterium]